MVRGLVIPLCVIAGGALACSRNSPVAPTALTVTRVTPMNASTYSGERVVVSGAGFRPGTTVTFGSAPAFVSALTGTEITVTTPSRGAGTEDIVVTNPSGDSVRVAGFEFLDFQVTSLEPAAGLPGWVVNLHGAGFRMGARVRFGGVPVTIHSIDSRRIRLTAPRLPPGVHDVEVINSDGQSVARPAGFEYLPVTVSINQSIVAPGGVVRVSWQCQACYHDPDFGIGDLLVISRAGDGDLDWMWDVGIFEQTGTVNVPAPMMPGDYEFRYLLGRRPYVSAPFTVGGDR